MLKRKFTIILIIAFFMICTFIVTSISYRNSIISIKNETNKTISGLTIILSNSDNLIKIPEILEKQIYNVELKLPENFIEGSLKIHYSDNYGNNHEEYIEGYVEKGYREKIIVAITSVDEKGVLLIKVEKKKGFLWFL